MPLISYYNQTLGSNELVKNESPFYKRHSFSLTVPDKIDYGKKDKNNNLIYHSMLQKGEKMRNNSIHGIIDQLPEIRYATGWDLSPMSTLTKTVEDLTDSKIIRAIATKNESFRPPLFTDGWTQKMTKSGSPLSLDFSFRCYPSEIYNTTTYKEVLKFLIYITTPREYFGTHSLEVISDAWNEANNDGLNIGKQVQQLVKKFKASDIKIDDLRKELKIPKDGEKGSDLYESIKALCERIDELGNTGDGLIGGAPMCQLEIGDMIKKSKNIFWMIKSWSFKPAINTSIIKNEGHYKVDPIYVDFNVSFETQQILTDKDLNEILI